MRNIKRDDSEKIFTELGNKVTAFWLDDEMFSKKNFYDTYDYAAFWKGREFEDEADRMAVRRLVYKIPQPHRTIIDVGGGIGRLVPLYENQWDRIIILDPSLDQLAVAKKNLSKIGKVDCVEGSAESIPLPARSCDAAICVRVFHHITNPRAVIREIARILTPEGHLILEIPNKMHMKARFYSLSFKKDTSPYVPISRSQKDLAVPFLNHHPAAIRATLEAEGFVILETLSVSNFRHAFFKNTIPSPILYLLERKFQRILAGLWFGPSIYFLAKKEIKKSSLKN